MQKINDKLINNRFCSSAIKRKRHTRKRNCSPLCCIGIYELYFVFYFCIGLHGKQITNVAAAESTTATPRRTGTGVKESTTPTTTATAKKSNKIEASIEFALQTATYNHQHGDVCCTNTPRNRTNFRASINPYFWYKSMNYYCISIYGCYAALCVCVYKLQCYTTYRTGEMCGCGIIFSQIFFFALSFSRLLSFSICGPCDRTTKSMECGANLYWRWNRITKSHSERALSLSLYLWERQFYCDFIVILYSDHQNCD